MRLFPTRLSPRLLTALMAAAPVVLGGGVLSHSSAAAQGPSGDYTGNACAVQLQGVKLALVSIPDQCLGGSGALPAGGGVVNGPTGPISVGGLLTANVLVSTAQGSNQISSAQSKVAGLTILPGTPNPIAGQPPLTADLVDVTVLSAATAVNCTGIQSPTNTVVASITVQGTTVNILNTPNQTISVGPVTLTINQQLYDAGTNTATGNALVIDLNVANVLTGKITVAHAESDLTHCTAALVSLPKTGSDQPEGVQFLNSQQPASSGVDGRFALIPVASLVFFAAVVVLSRTLGRRYARRMAEKG